MDNGFWFDSRHSLDDMGVIAIRDKKRTVSAPGEVRSYAVGGMQGDLAFGDSMELKPYTQVVRLYADVPLDTDTAATAKWRELVAWLGVGRCPLVWDCEPDKQIMAEVVDYTGDPSGWVDEGLKVTLKCQPLMRSVTPMRTTISIDYMPPDSVTLPIDTMLPAPLDISIKVLGACTLDALIIRVGDSIVRATGLGVGTGETLRIRMEYPCGAEIIRQDGSVEMALKYFTSFQRLEAVNGDQLTLVPIMSAENTEEISAEVTIEARGVWR